MTPDTKNGAKQADTKADVARRHPEGYREVLEAAEEAGLPLAESLRQGLEEAAEGSV